jgi:hypothetical protein
MSMSLGDPERKMVKAAFFASVLLNESFKGCMANIFRQRRRRGIYCP